MGTSSIDLDEANKVQSSSTPSQKSDGGTASSKIDLDEADKAQSSSTASQESDGGASGWNHSSLDLFIGAFFGCIATSIVVALIRYGRSPKDWRWWTRNGQEYEPLTRNDEHEQEDQWLNSEKV